MKKLTKKDAELHTLPILLYECFDKIEKCQKFYIGQICPLANCIS